MPHRTARPARAEPREIGELRRLKAENPQLASAVDLQIELLMLQRRVQTRVPLPTVAPDQIRTRQHGNQDHALLRFKEIPLDWSDFRLLFREAAELLHRHDALEETDYRRALALVREGNTLEPIVVSWYERASSSSAGMLDQIILLAMRPFLARCAEALLPHLDPSPANRRRCPLCGGEPELATITPAAERMLICVRCGGQWAFHALACPFCDNDDRSAITSFATRDGLYRIYACDVCRRYLKAYDGRAASRPVMTAVDSVATLPLDAAAIQRGYRSE